MTPVAMDISPTPSDRKRTRRWPLVAAGFLAACLLAFFGFQIFTPATANERATDIAQRMVVTQELSEIEARIIPQFEQETGCHVVVYLPLFGQTPDDVARQTTRVVHRWREASRGNSTTVTGLGVGEATAKTTESDSVRGAEYLAMVAVVDCKAPYLEAEE